MIKLRWVVASVSLALLLAASPRRAAADGIEVSAAGQQAALKVRNRTPFIVIIYIGGKRVGWLRPYKTGVLRGLKKGYHRVYAHSRWGSTYWGPKSVWVPGTWSLSREAR